MLKFINLKKLTAKTLVSILMVGSLVTPSGTRKAFAANSCPGGNNGHGNNAPYTHYLDSGKLTIAKYDPSNPGQNKDRLIADLDAGLQTADLHNNRPYKISYVGYDGSTSYNLTVDEAKAVEASHPDWEIHGNQDTSKQLKPGCGDQDNNGIDDAFEVGSNFDNPIDTDGDGKPDFIDTDDDGDGVLDIDEAMPSLWGIDEDDGQLFSMGDYTDSSTMTDYGLLKWNNSGTIETIGEDMEAMTLDENGDMYIALDRKLSGTGRGATLLKFNIADAKTIEDGGDNVVRVIGEIGINFVNSDYNVSGLSIDPYTGNLVALLKNGGSDTDKLFVISKSNGSVVKEIGDIEGLGEASTDGEDIEHAPDGTLYVTDNADDHTYKVNGLTGAIIEVIDDSQKDGLGSDSVKFEALGWDFANNRLIGFDDNDESLARLTKGKGNNQKYYDTSDIGLTDVEGVDFVPTIDGQPTEFLDYDDDGVEDPIEQEPADSDEDSDNDGISDEVEGTGDIDGDRTPNYLDTDSDNNGIDDEDEVGSDSTAPVDSDRDTIPDYLDEDDDNNGIKDVIEIGNDPANNRGYDLDGDGTPDIYPNDLDDDGTPDYLDEDDDGDGISDKKEITESNSSVRKIDYDVDGDGENDVSAYDTDGDNIPDYLEEDSDNDGIKDVDEGDGDADGDGFPNYQDLDSDNNSILDENEGLTSRLDDIDNDGTRDFLDTDDDDDGIIDVIEIGNNPDYPTNSDNDTSDGYDYQDTDSDNDGMLDINEGIKTSAPDEVTTVIKVEDRTKAAGTTRTSYKLQDIDPDDTKKNGSVCVDADDSGNKCVIKVSPVGGANNGTVTINKTITGLDSQIYNYAD